MPLDHLLLLLLLLRLVDVDSWERNAFAHLKNCWENRVSPLICVDLCEDEFQGLRLP